MTQAVKDFPITKSGVRILRPAEFEGIRGAALGPGWQGCKDGDGQTVLDAGLYTGMRYVELQRFQWNGTKWVRGKFIHLPKEAVLKAKRKQLERYVRLSDRGVEAVGKFLKVPTVFPTWWAWTDALKRWAKAAGIDPVQLGPKTTRKTWESWLVFYYADNPTAWAIVAQSQGHTSATSLAHYLNMPFLPEDREAIRPYVEGYF
jgi:integrase